MPRAATLLQLRTDVRQRCDIENDTGHISDAELNRYINQSVTRLRDRLVRLRGESYFREDVLLTTTAGAATTPLPADFYKLIGLDWQIGGGEFQILRALEFEERWRYSGAPVGWSRGAPVRYSLELSNLVRWFPTPTTLETVTLWYVQTPTLLVLDADQLDGIDGWEELVVLDAGIKCQIKRERPIQELMLERDKLERDVEAVAGWRDHGSPPKVADVEPRGRVGPEDWPA